MIRNIHGLWVPEGYDAPLDIRETELAIKLIKDFVEQDLASKLNLTRVSAPLFVRPRTGLNDNLNGVERPVADAADAFISTRVGLDHVSFAPTPAGGPSKV